MENELEDKSNEFARPDLACQCRFDQGRAVLIYIEYI